MKSWNNLVNFPETTKMDGYKPHLAQVPSLANKESRLAAFRNILLADVQRRLDLERQIVRREMVCFTTITKQASIQTDTRTLGTPVKYAHYGANVIA